MDFDEDGPPELIETGDELAEEETSVRVPITIVTGRCLGHILYGGSKQ